MPKLNWRKTKDHPETFESGDRYLVAYWIPYTLTWEVAVITIRCDVREFRLLASDGQKLDVLWDDYDYYIPINEVVAGLPKGGGV